MIDFIMNMEAGTWKLIIECLLLPLLVLWIGKKYEASEKRKENALTKEDAERSNLIAAKERLEEERHQSLVKQNGDLITKVTGYCEQNLIAHRELYDAKNSTSERLTQIETIHRMKGCSRSLDLKGGINDNRRLYRRTRGTKKSALSRQRSSAERNHRSWLEYGR